jgi:hypothetical protein
MIDPRDCAFFIPPNLKKFKLALFERIGDHMRGLGGMVVRHDYAALVKLAGKKIPIVGCSPPFADAIRQWQADGTPWIYWDRGYLRRVFATWLPTGAQLGVPGGYYRWQANGFQMTTLRDVPGDRWRALKLEASVKPWRRGGDKIVIADTLPDYWDVRGLPRDWSRLTADYLRRFTKRPIEIRGKEESWQAKLSLADDLAGAHCLVTHGSIAAVEAAVMGCPVFVDPSSTAALVGSTDLQAIETPIYPERERWLWALAYGQFNEKELCNGVLWRLIDAGGHAGPADCAAAQVGNAL